MTEDIFQLLGFDAPLSHYPAPVVPIGLLGNKLVAVFITDDDPAFVRLDNDVEYIQFSESALRNLADFNPSKQRLFALNREDVKSYAIDDEQRIFLALLKQKFFSSNNPFFRLSLAKIVNRPSILLREISLCARHIYLSSPEMLDSWYLGQLDSLREHVSEDVYAALPSNWRDLHSVPSSGGGSVDSDHVSTDSSESDSDKRYAYGAGAAMARMPVATGLFKSREGFEFGCQTLVVRGYSLNQVNIMMSESTLASAFPEVTEVTEESKTALSAEEDAWWNAGNDFSEQIVNTITDGSVFSFQDYRVFISGPLQRLLSDPESQGQRVPSNLTELFVGEGLPGGVIRQYESGIAKGSIAILMNPKNKEQEGEIHEEWAYDQI